MLQGKGKNQPEEMALSDGEEARYRITFLGPVRNDLAHVNTLAEGLKARFKLTDEAVTKMMRMAPVVIKKEATVAEAQRYKTALEAIGARVQVEPAEVTPNAESPGPVHQTAADPAALDREPRVIPVKAKPAPAPRDAAPAEQAGAQMVTCPQCGFGQSTTDECVKCGVIISKFMKYQGEVKPTDGEGAFSGAAEASADSPQPQRMIGVPLAEPTGSTPWEDMASLGFMAALFRTIKEVLFSPTAFFKRMPVDKGLSSPLFFGVIISFLGTTVGLLIQYALSGVIGSFTPSEEGMAGTGVTYFQTAFLVIYAIVLPLLIAIGFFIASGIFHICLMIVGAGKRGFEATFRVVAYTSSSQIFALVPLVGGIVIAMYNLVLWTIGFREVHHTTTGKAFIAVLLPVVIIVFFVLLIVFAVIIPLIFSQGQQMQPPPPSL
jgi:hypothetical protein